jgi:hypothetical protein
VTEKTVALLTDPHPRSHIVLAYNDDARFIESVGLFVAAGLSNGEAVLLVMTRQHRSDIETHLEEEGFDVPALSRDGLLTTFDASHVLCEFFEGDHPDAELFMNLVGKMVETARSHSLSGKVRVYGEMVNLLCGRNHLDAAAHLEELWNEAIEANSVPLLCSYSLHTLRLHTSNVLPQRILNAHSHTLLSS